MTLSFKEDILMLDGREFRPAVRTFAQMVPVLAFPQKKHIEPETALYWMYRAVKKYGSLRYDITRISAFDLCGEYNKTFGHLHPNAPAGTPWPEIYEVLEGKAHFLLQKVTNLGVQDAVLVSAKKGEKLLIPPGYGHVTINPSLEKELLLANLVCDAFEADYRMFAQMKGACFYELSDGKLLRNRNYGDGFEIRKKSANDFCSAYGVFAKLEKKSLLQIAESQKEALFLVKPETFY
ncbi:MAG: glucose-6-phosphate isomerase [Candidatus Micrarchaeota archaeon]|nr:glucose-6-phosphate isomerase [Candidatus Micrarchaeota archaeon]